MPLQQKIAHILTTIDKLIDKTQALIDKHTAIKQGMMADLFTRGIDLSGTPDTNPNHGQLRPPYEEAPELYKQTELGWVPKEWEVERLGDLAEVLDPQPDHRTPPEDEMGIPYVGVGDFTEDYRINSRKCRKVVERAYLKQRARFRVDFGDVIFGKIGTIGEPKQLKETDGFALSANILLIKTGESNRYIYDFLQSSLFDVQLKLIINTTSQPALGIQTMRNIAVQYPCCESERLLIQTRMQSLDNLLAKNRKLLNKHKSMKKGLMQDLLTGKVKVSND